MGRTTHNRALDHHGLDYDTAVILSATLGDYVAGTTLASVLSSLVSRLKAVEEGARMHSFMCNADLKKTMASTFAADAVRRRTTASSFTANAVLQ